MKIADNALGLAQHPLGTPQTASRRAAALKVVAKLEFYGRGQASRIVSVWR